MSSFSRVHLLNQNIAGIQRWLQGFPSPASGRIRRARLGRTAEYVVIEAFPLPDRYRPDEIDILLLVENFPMLPPIGLYVLNRGTEGTVGQLRSTFNAFADTGFHGALALPGFTWMCFQYLENRWRFNSPAPHRGDNLRKFLATFFALAA